MANPYIGEIRMFGGNFAPADWAFCSGQLLEISQFDALFTLIGTTYGGDGQTNFALPNLQGRLPVHQGQGNALAQTAGTETVTLQSNQIPSHDHPFNATGTASTSNPSGAYPATTTSTPIYETTATPPAAAMDQKSIGSAGGNQPHDNMMPYLAVSFIISLFGVFPTQN